jgi:hypothetical protein
VKQSDKQIYAAEIDRINGELDAMTARAEKAEKEVADAKSMATHYESLFNREQVTHGSTFTLYHRYFVAQQQTQKGLNRMVRKVARLKAKIKSMEANHDR